MAGRAFAKYEGLGNDFVLVDAAREDELDSAGAVRVCDRRRGVGADGVLLVLPPRERDHAARMKVLNADGSTPEMCGNGLRCVALHVADKLGLRGGELSIETDAGPRSCLVEREGGEVFVTVDMGPVRLDGSAFLDVGAEPIELDFADAGNPHAVTFGSASTQEAARIGPVVAVHPRFPRGTNVELCAMREGGLDVVVWERGVGLTLACGTGACAAAAVACRRGLVAYDTPIDVRLPGGTLVVTIQRGTGRATMRGPARRVFAGSFA